MKKAFSVLAVGIVCMVIVGVALGQGEKQAVEPLVKKVWTDKDLKDVQVSTVEALGKIKNKREKQEKPIFSEAEKKADELVYKLECGDLGDKFAAASELAKIGKPAVRFLIHALKDGDECVRRYAIEVLGAIGDKRAIPHLKKVWKEDKSKETQVCAADALVRIEKNKDAYKFLIEVSEDRSSSARYAAKGALEEIRMGYPERWDKDEWRGY